MDQEQDRDVRNKNQALKKSGKKLTVIEKSLVIRVISLSSHLSLSGHLGVK